MYAVFSVPPEKKAEAEEVLRDDLVSRQSIVIREGGALGFADLPHLIVVEGSEAGVRRAADLFREVGDRLDGDRAEAVYRAVKAQEDDAASGMGLIFGE